MSASSRASACISTWLVGPRWCEGATCPEGEAEAGGKGPASLTMVPMPPPGCHRGQGRASAVFGGIRSTVQAASGESGELLGAGGRRSRPGDGREGQWVPRSCRSRGQSSVGPAEPTFCPAARGRAFLSAGLCVSPTRSHSSPQQTRSQWPRAGLSPTECEQK